MKIAVVAPSFIPSDSANSIQVMKVCQALLQCGETVKLWVPLAGGQSQKVNWDYLKSFYGLEEPFEIEWVPENLRFRRYDFTWKATRAAKKWGAEVLYTWMVQAALLGSWMGLLPVLELHMLPSGLFGPFLLRSFTSSKQPKLLLPITQALQDRLDDDFHIRFHDNGTLVAPMGSEPERYHELGASKKLRSELGLPDEITAVYTGHLYEGRGMEILVALAKAFPTVSFVWVGGRDKDVKLWSEQIHQMGLSNITLTGFVHHALIPAYQKAADILLMPYQKNVGISGAGDTAEVCSPMKLFEYLSAGRVILTSDLPVFHEVLNDQNAVFCPPDEEDAWIEAFGSLIADEERRKRLSSQAQKDAETYSWKNRARRVLDKLAQLQ
jgi:glycosyltransferase involved in cell wall biosynthesis